MVTKHTTKFEIPKSTFLNCQKCNNSNFQLIFKSPIDNKVYVSPFLSSMNSGYCSEIHRNILNSYASDSQGRVHNCTSCGKRTRHYSSLSLNETKKITQLFDLEEKKRDDEKVKRNEFLEKGNKKALAMKPVADEICSNICNVAKNDLGLKKQCNFHGKDFARYFSIHVDYIWGEFSKNPPPENGSFNCIIQLDLSESQARKLVKLLKELKEE